MVTVQGIQSVLDRTLFTNKGPLVKAPSPILTGLNLRIVSETEVEISTGSFGNADVGRAIEIIGSPSGRNDGTFVINEVRTSKRLRLANANFDISDVAQTTALVIALANSLKEEYEGHRIQQIEVDEIITSVHGTNDIVNFITAPISFDLSTAITLLNNIRTKFSAHVIDVSGDPQVHRMADIENIPESPAATGLASAIVLANELRRKYETHRHDRFVHQIDDSINRVTVTAVKVVKGVFPGPLTGPFQWILQDLRLGTVANDPTDVSVSVNSLPAAVDAVFGLLGAVVLQVKPGGTDTVSVDYDFLGNPPARFLRSNSPEFNTNQAGNHDYAGLPQHRYRSRSYIIDPGHSPDLMSAVAPLQIGWKYKALERASSALLNDPTTLLTNVPTNRTSYPVLFEKIQEITIRYDPVTLPQNATDPWVLDGVGTFSLASGGNELTIFDQDIQTGPESMPPFFHHAVDLRAPSIVSAAFRAKALDDSSLHLDGVFTGVSFGLSDGQKVAIIGFLVTEATNLSSSIVLSNSLKAKFNSHLTNLGSHVPNDDVEAVGVVDATALESLLILSNELRIKYSDHIVKGSGVGFVHQASDTFNTITSSAAVDLSTAIILLNELRIKFNAHREQAGVHFVNDLNNLVDQIKQVGILTNRGFSEFQDSWNSFATDWTEHKTYRLFREGNGSVAVFLSGETDPDASAALLELPSLSDIDGKFDPAQQVFFGPIGRESTSTSKWQFIRVNVTPIDANLIESNKFVDYSPVVVPELDPVAPWITVGQGGSERIIPGSVLLLDSSASAPASEVAALGQTSGAYRGFVRLEPIMTVDTATIVEFRTAVDYYTFGLDNKAASVLLDDGTASIQFAFLQFSPSPATVTGTASEPLAIVAGDKFRFKIGNGPELTTTFAGADITAALVAAAINVTAGFTFADDFSGRVRLTSTELGAQANFTVISGNALVKLGFSPGPYFGLDSNPEPRISWFGANFPDLDEPAWNRGGTEESEMLGRTMRLIDDSSSDYVAFSLSDPLITAAPINPASDWKLDFRTRVLSFIAGTPIPAGFPYSALSPIGVIASIDEGPGGKNIEVHLAVDGSGNSFVNLLSFNSGTNALDVKSQYAFAWNDGQFHTVNVFTSKGSNLILVLGDGQVLTPFVGPSPTYTGLNSGATGPSVSFGSGGEPVVGADLRSPKSVVDWTSVDVFRDSKIGDPSAVSRRFIGLYRGGDPTVLNSYLIYQVDWTVSHTYRILRDPRTAVSVYIDGGAIPIISAAYDVLTLPLSSASFLGGVTGEHAAIAFGAFNPGEIDRMRWEFFRYSMGKITTSDRIIPPHNLLNRANAVASPDHLRTTKSHVHAGFTTYSGGTPTDDFMADPEVASFTVLGEGTPPVPMTQNLESRDGLRKIATAIDSIPAIDVVNTKGFITDLEDDTENSVSSEVSTVAATTAALIILANDLKAKYNAHRITVPIHFGGGDGVHIVATPNATNLATAITLLIDIATQYTFHITDSTFHSPIDLVNLLTVTSASDVETAVLLANEIKLRFAGHERAGNFHIFFGDIINVVTSPNATDLTSAALLADDLRTNVNAHFLAPGFHPILDSFNDLLEHSVSGLGFSTVTAGNVLTTAFPLALGDTVRFLEGPNIGVDRTIFLILGANQYAVAGIFPFNDAIGNRFARVVGGNPSLDPSTVIRLTNSLLSHYDRHLTQPGVHIYDDLMNSVVSPEALAISDTFPILNSLKAAYNLHRVGFFVHYQHDVTNDVTASDALSPLATSIITLNELRTAYLSHLIQIRVHLEDDFKNALLPPEATNLATAIVLANSFKIAFNLHRTATVFETQKVHSEDDIVNVVTAPDATDITTLADLVGILHMKYESHRIEPGVHGSSLFIRLSPPDRVLYSSMKFYEFETGEAGHVAPFSDDETLHVDGIFQGGSQTFSYSADVLPENLDQLKVVELANDLRAKYEAHRTQAGVHPVNDVVNFITSPAAIDLSSAITLLTELRTKFNGHLIQPTVHISNDTTDKLFVNPPSEVKTAASLAMEAMLKYGRHRLSTSFHSMADNVNRIIAEQVIPVVSPGRHYGWQRIDGIGEGVGPINVSLQNVGPRTVLRYGVSSEISRYASATGIPDMSSLGFELEVTMRVNSFTYSPNVDTGIYAGLLSMIGPGISPAIGFDALNNIPYVKIQDVNRNIPLFRVPFNWADGNFHTYKIVRDAKTNTIGLVIVS